MLKSFMYKKECKWCKKRIEVEKQCLFALHISNCYLNPNKIKRIEKYKTQPDASRYLCKKNRTYVGDTKRLREQPATTN